MLVRFQRSTTPTQRKLIVALVLFTLFYIFVVYVVRDSSSSATRFSTFSVSLAATAAQEFCSKRPVRLIPQIIHQLWLKSNAVGSFNVNQAFVKSWLLKHKRWSYMLWTDDDALKLFQTQKKLQPFKDVYQSSATFPRSVLARYAFLYIYGGVFVHTDVECLHSFDRFSRALDAFVIAKEEVTVNKTLIADDLMFGSKPGHPFVLKLLEDTAREISLGTCDSAECLSDLVSVTYDAYISESWGEPVTILPSQYFPSAASFVEEDEEPTWKVYAQVHESCSDCLISDDSSTIWKFFSGFQLERPFSIRDP